MAMQWTFQRGDPRASDHVSDPQMTATSTWTAQTKSLSKSKTARTCTDPSATTKTIDTPTMTRTAASNTNIHWKRCYGQSPAINATKMGTSRCNPCSNSKTLSITISTSGLMYSNNHIYRFYLSIWKIHKSLNIFIFLQNMEKYTFQIYQT